MSLGISPLERSSPKSSMEEPEADSANDPDASASGSRFRQSTQTRPSSAVENIHPSVR
jgi:hypothetical protein